MGQPVSKPVSKPGGGVWKAPVEQATVVEPVAAMVQDGEDEKSVSVPASQWRVLAPFLALLGVFAHVVQGGERRKTPVGESEGGSCDPQCDANLD